MAKFLKILILIIIICFLPTEIFGFFATPDNHIYSMPFGVQKNNPGVRPLAPGASNLDVLQTELLQNSLAENPSNSSSQDSLNPNSRPKMISILTFITWPLIILVFVAIFIFIKRKLQE